MIPPLLLDVKPGQKVQYIYTTLEHGFHCFFSICRKIFNQKYLNFNVEIFATCGVHPLLLKDGMAMGWLSILF